MFYSVQSEEVIEWAVKEKYIAIQAINFLHYGAASCMPQEMSN